MKRLLLMLLLSCGEAAPSGLDLGAIDESIEPCADFYRYACGGWIEQHPLSADAARESRFSDPFYDVVPRVRSLVESASSLSDDPEERLIARYFGSCLNAPSSFDARTQLKALAEQIDGTTTLEQLAIRIAEQRELGSNTFFGFGVGIDPGNTSRYLVYLGEGGVELPDPSYYLEAEHEGLLAHYRAHIEALSGLVLGSPLDADAVLRVETALASEFVPSDEFDPLESYHPLSAAETATLAPSFPWETYFRASGFESLETINVQHPDYVRALERLFTAMPMSDLIGYMKWQLIQDRSSELDQPAIDQDFSFWSTFSGRVSPLPSEWVCFLRTLDALDAPIGRKFFEMNDYQGRIDIAHGLAAEVASSFARRIDAASWLDEPTRSEAHAKLDRVLYNIGKPATWPSFADLDFEELAYFDMNSRLVERALVRRRERLNEPVDRTAWPGPTLSNNAFYHWLLNSVTIDALVLQSPFFLPGSPRARNLGALGSLIGHELTHGFDDGGRRYDGNGMLRDWWSSEAAERFDERAQCLIAQFDGFEPLPGMNINGALTLGENIADQGGIAIAHGVLTEEDEGGNGFDASQVFFLAYAQMWCANARPEYVAARLVSDPHSPEKFRVNGPLSNLSEFAEAFQCQPGDAMVMRSPCEVW